MRTNRTKELLNQGKVALGSIAGQIRSAEVARLYAAAGLDWIFIDTEHGCHTVETVQDLVRASLMTDMTPIVRLPDFQYSLVARALDMGAEGIILPRAESPELLAKAVSWTKFPPVGVRGFGLGVPQVGYQTATFDEIIGHYNDQTLVAFQIESQVALDRRDELISVPGVDAVMIGPADLSISLGVAGQFEHPKLVEAIMQVIETCNKYDRIPAIQVRSPALAKFWIDRGMKLVGCGADLAILWDAVSSMATDLKAARGD
jgi:2-dehydro-3-deoxyglucarate aldolase/4-hydroxy-2-oxoheptanedioate aldolase